MSESGAKSSQPLASKGEKDVAEKRGRGRPRKKPQVRGVPWEEGMGGEHPTGQLCPRGPGTPRLWGSKKPPHLHPGSIPLAGMGVPRVQPPLPPFRQHLSGAADPSWGGFQSPPQPCNTPELLLTQGRAGTSPRSSPGCS